MKTNELFISELKKYLNTLEFVNTPENNNKIYSILCNYYMSRDVNVTSDLVKKIIGIQPGLESYTEINEDVREILEDYINNLFSDIHCNLVDHYISEFDNGNFDEDDMNAEEWIDMSEEERAEYIHESFSGEAFGYTDMTSYILNEVSDRFEDLYSKAITKELKKAIKNNVEVEGNEYEDEYTFKYKKEPLNIVLKAAEMTKRELIECLTDYYTMNDIMEDIVEEDEINDEAIANVIGNIISRNR